MGDEALSEALLSVWQQVMVDKKDAVEMGGEVLPVRRTGSKRLRCVTFTLEGRSITGVEQNPRTTSKWAQMARRGALIMQFMEGNLYLANVADGKVFLYH